jgi:murein DD-endopeptidase MepM/ murein hydrolase activator NlpD
MKDKILVITSIILIVVSFIALPIDTSAKTIQEFEEQVAQYTKELEEKKANLAENDEEVAAIKKKISQIAGQIKVAQEEIGTLQEEIIACEEEIKRKSAESKKIIEYYQVSNGENAYLEYAFGANDITDMIYRMSIVEQLTEYNDNLMKELEELIQKNKQRQKELEEKQQELEQLQVSLRKEQAKIEAESAAIKDSMPSIENQIKSAQDSVKYYKSLGCGATEDIQACEYRIAQASANSLPSVGTFQRPIANGYYVRGFTGKYGHTGVDMSSNNKSIEVYPIAAGVVHKIYRDSCNSSWCAYGCNGNANIVVVKHNYNGSYLYSSYVHLRRYGNISEGQYVSKDTVLGYMGTTGCSTGPHLHLEIADCHWQKGVCTYYSSGKTLGYLDRLKDPAKYVTFPSRWTNR